MEGERGQGVGEYFKAKGNGLSRIERSCFSSSSTSSDVFRLESENGEIHSSFNFFLAYQALHGTSRAEASTSGRAAAAATGRGATIFFFARRCRGGGFQIQTKFLKRKGKVIFFGFQFSV